MGKLLEGLEREFEKSGIKWGELLESYGYQRAENKKFSENSKENEVLHIFMGTNDNLKENNDDFPRENEESDNSKEDSI